MKVCVKYFDGSCHRNLLNSHHLQYLRQKVRTGWGFCRKAVVELLSTTTQLLTYEEARDGHCSTFTLPPTRSDSHHPPPIQPDCLGHARDDGTDHDARHLSLGRQRRQLPHRPTFFRPSTPMGHPLLGVLSSACVPSKGCLRAGRR